MKLFYHFLIFVFVSLLLVACAHMFSNDDEGKTLNNRPSGLEHNRNDQFDDSVATNPLTSPFILAHN
ncbi:MAG: hypothetical protein JWR38_4106 [Mucilaginibacter sp.]|nr:hypothetical protein [Mucilaginibacter sp.]